MDIDKQLWRDHGLYTSSESESGKSDFDEDYFKLRPPYNADDHRNSTIISIECNQFSTDGENKKLKVPVSTPCKSDVLLDQNNLENISTVEILNGNSNLEVNNTNQSNVESETKKKKKGKKSKKKKKKKVKSIEDEHRCVNSASSKNVFGIVSYYNCSEGYDLVKYEENQSQVSLREVCTEHSSYSEENIDSNFSNENKMLIAMRNFTSKLDPNSFSDYSQYHDLMAYETATYYLNLEQEYLTNMSCLNPLLENKDIKLTEILDSEQIDLTHAIEHRNGFWHLETALLEMIIFELRPFQTIFQELWNEFF